jgi:lipopolysaccharide export LptBFGC system permease protein LptF
MMRSSRLIRAALSRVCAPTTILRLIDPTLDDIEVERAEALRAGRQWRARWIVLAGYGGFCRALMLYAFRVMPCVLLDLPRRTTGLAVLCFAFFTFVLVLPPLLATTHRHASDVALLGLLLLPQAIPLAIPLALSVGIVHGWPRWSSRRPSMRRMLVVALVASAVSLATREWLMPAANQAFRTTVAGRDLPRGLAERSLLDLHRPLRRFSGVADADAMAAAIRELAGDRQMTPEALSLILHQHLVLCASGAVVGLLVVAIARTVRRVPIARAVFVVFLGLYIVAFFNMAAAVEHFLVRPAVAAWLPSGYIAAAALVSWRIRATG